MPNFSYADGAEVAELVRNSEAGKDYVVVDVRDNDFEGGNIPKALNYPSADFTQTLDELVQRTANVPKVIFHCALSQARGPKMARIYAEEVERRGYKVQLDFQKDAAAGSQGGGADDSNADNTGKEAQKGDKEVIVLRGGFTRWQEKFKDDPELVENWKASIWAGY